LISWNLEWLLLTTVPFKTLVGELLMATILTVDDSASMRQMVSYTLQVAGYQVTEAKDGVEALEKALAQKFNLVITDVNMPNMDGITLTRELRALSDYKFTPILTLTTEAGQNKKAEGKNAGATGWIIKPFNPDQLLATIKKVLD
jgi:two-component system chemotaxis response regulator CheY